jgi:cellulose synthase/poly-beta-1,6-N-acetylglucosamine synthase-like glycosyltransferase
VNRVERQTATHVLNRGQCFFFGLIAAATVYGLTWHRHFMGLAAVAVSLSIFIAVVGFKLFVGAASIGYKPPVYSMPLATDDDLPIYSIFVPLYHEANMLPSLADAINGLDYPKERLQVLLLLEEDDTDTRSAAHILGLPAHFEIHVVPNALPKGKPKALNYGLAHARGEYCVIYDAEDRPDADQLLKAVGTFRSVPGKVACLQARLYFWNETSSWITRFYWSEYIIHFQWILGGLSRLGLVPPLGGTSNHFRTQVLHEVAIEPEYLPEDVPGIGGWDPWNVTEDAELAGALALGGYRVMMIDSVTGEEATATLRAADHQRRRWLKGYAQTGLMYTRHPFQTARQMGFRKWFCYNLLMLGTPITLLLNPVFWAATIIYFTTRASIIARLFPLPLFYTGLALMVAGNLILFYQIVVACLRREGYSSVKYALLTPVWWLFMSWSCYAMAIELMRPSKRHVWHKTTHGHDLALEAELKAATVGEVLQTA